MNVNSVKEIKKLVQELSEQELDEVVDYIIFLKSKREKEVFEDLLLISESG